MKIDIFYNPVSFNALDQGHPFEIPKVFKCL